MNPNTIGQLVNDARRNGPVTLRFAGRTYKATPWSTFDLSGPTWPQIEAARDCPCPTCRYYGRKETR